MSNINLNGSSKKIILNGTTYYAGGQSGGGSSTPGIERLFYASENSANRATDHQHIAYFDDGVGTIDEDANYDDYLMYDSGKFYVKQGFTALIIPWTYEYDTASGSYAHGEFYINDTKIKGWTVDYKSVGYYAGCAFTHTFSQGDSFYSYTPNGNGYPEQNLRLFKIDSSLTSLFDDMFAFTENEMGGIGKIIDY